MGYAADSNGNAEAFLYQNGSMVALGALPGQAGSSIARAINASGEIVGTSGEHAFLYQNGTMIDLGTLSGGYATPMASTTPGEWSASLTGKPSSIRTAP